jgi:hypothetical protein
MFRCVIKIPFQLAVSGVSRGSWSVRNPLRPQPRPCTLSEGHTERPETALDGKYRIERTVGKQIREAWTFSQSSLSPVALILTRDLMEED